MYNVCIPIGLSAWILLREIARRTEEFGSVARAVDTIATETYDVGQTAWANLTDRNPSTVTRTGKN